MTLNVPNVLTVVRILLVPVMVAALLVGTPDGLAVAAAVFAIAAASDVLDGRIARSRGSVSTFGKVMDPIADKLLVAAALLALVSLDRLAAWVALVIIAREFAVTGLRVVAGQQGRIISASGFGKAKTVTQVITIFALIAAPDPSALWVSVLVWVTVAITIASGADYFLNFRRRVDAPAGVPATKLR